MRKKVQSVLVIMHGEQTTRNACPGPSSSLLTSSIWKRTQNNAILKKVSCSWTLAAICGCHEQPYKTVYQVTPSCSLTQGENIVSAKHFHALIKGGTNNADKACAYDNQCLRRSEHVDACKVPLTAVWSHLGWLPRTVNLHLCPQGQQCFINPAVTFVNFPVQNYAVDTDSSLAQIGKSTSPCIPRETNSIPAVYSLVLPAASSRFLFVEKDSAADHN